MTEHPSKYRTDDRFRVAACADVVGTEVLLYHQIQDISEGGMCVTTATAESVGSEVDVTLTFPKTAAEIPVRGQVMWVSDEDQRRRLGLRWLDLSSDERVALRKHIAASVTSMVSRGPED